MSVLHNCLPAHRQKGCSALLRRPAWQTRPAGHIQSIPPPPGPQHNPGQHFFQAFFFSSFSIPFPLSHTFLHCPFDYSKPQLKNERFRQNFFYFLLFFVSFSRTGPRCFYRGPVQAFRCCLPFSICFSAMPSRNRAARASPATAAAALKKMFHWYAPFFMMRAPGGNSFWMSVCTPADIQEKTRQRYRGSIRQTGPGSSWKIP